MIERWWVKNVQNKKSRNCRKISKLLMKKVLSHKKITFVANRSAPEIGPIVSVDLLLDRGFRGCEWVTVVLLNEHVPFRFVWKWLVSSGVPNLPCVMSACGATGVVVLTRCLFLGMHTVPSFILVIFWNRLTAPRGPVSLLFDSQTNSEIVYWYVPNLTFFYSKVATMCLVLDIATCGFSEYTLSSFGLFDK